MGAVGNINGGFSKAAYAMKSAGFTDAIAGLETGKAAKSVIASAAAAEGCTKPLNSIAHECAPRVDNPWLRVACFDVQDGVITKLDCSVRRAIWSIAEMQQVLVISLCHFFRLIRK